MATPLERDALARLLAGAGCVAPHDEAEELRSCASGEADRLASLLARRMAGEPLAWITGRTRFCGETVRIDSGVYVPRWQSEQLALRAVARLPADGVAVDLCTGSGAVARVLSTRRPGARVVATDTDERAVACAAANGVEVFLGDLFAPLPRELDAHVDLVVGVVPYVPTAALALLPRDTLTFESPLPYDGGPDGTATLRRVVAGAPRYLRAGGALLLELGGEQAGAIKGDLARHGFRDVSLLTDEEGDVRGIEATLDWSVRDH